MIRHSLAVVLLVFLATGCDLTGQYDKELQKSFQNAGQRAVFDLNLHPNFTEVIDSAKQNIGVKLRLPKVFDGSSKALPLDRVKMSGVSYILERQLDDDSGQFMSCFLIFAVVPKTEIKPDVLQNTLVQGGKLGSANAAWSDVNLPMPTGQSISLKRLRTESKQQVPVAGKKAVEADVRGDSYLIDAGANSVVIMWTTPKAQAQKYNLEAAIEAAMGTLENTAPPAGPAGKAPPAGGKAG